MVGIVTNQGDDNELQAAKVPVIIEKAGEELKTEESRI